MEGGVSEDLGGGKKCLGGGNFRREAAKIFRGLTDGRGDPGDKEGMGPGR